MTSSPLLFMLFQLTLYILLTLTLGTPISNETLQVDKESFPQLSADYQDDLSRYAKFSAISYCSREEYGLKLGPLKTSCGGEYSLCTEFNESIEVIDIYRGDINGIVFKDDLKRELIWLFKGTTRKIEWQLNLNAKTKTYYSFETNKLVCNKCKIHKGFYQGANEVWNSMSSKFKELIKFNPDYKISVTGHSLGGSIAVLIANELKMLGYEVKLVTFGQPKIGNYKTSDWMDQFWGVPQLNDPNGVLPNGMIRVTNKGDIVPFLPLTASGFGHSGVEIYFKDASLPTNMEEAVIRGKWSKEKSIKEEFGVRNIFLKTAPTRLIHTLYFVRMNRCLKD